MLTAAGDLLLQQNGVLTRRQARASGLRPWEIAELLRSTEWRSPHYGVLRAGSDQRDDADLRAALLSQCPDGVWTPGVAIARESAAAIHGIRGCASTPWIHLAVPRDWTPQHRRTGVRLHRCLTPGRHVVQLSGLPVTGAAWTALTLARFGPRWDAVAMVDSALRSERCTPADLRDALPLLRGLRGVVQARDVVDLAREGVDSPQESRTRMAIVDGGLQQPDVSIKLYDAAGRLLARGELGYRRSMIWLEYDGYDVHIRRGVFRTDRSRQNWLARRGWYVLRFVDDHLAHGGRRLQDDVRHALVHAPARVAALAPGLSQEADEARIALRG